MTETAYPLTSPVLLFWCATRQQFVYSALWTAEVVAGLYVMQFVCPLCRQWQVETESDVPAIGRKSETPLREQECFRPQERAASNGQCNGNGAAVKPPDGDRLHAADLVRGGRDDR